METVEAKRRVFYRDWSTVSRVYKRLSKMRKSDRISSMEVTDNLDSIRFSRAMASWKPEWSQ